MLMRKKDRRANRLAEYGDMLFPGQEDILIIAGARDYLIEYISPGGQELLGIRQDMADTVAELFGQLGFTGGLSVQDLKNKEKKEVEGYLKDVGSGQALWCKINWRFAQSEELEEERLLIRISDRSQEQERLDRLRRELTDAKNSNIAKSRFLSTISHDIRTPMNAIIGLTDLATEHREENDKLQEYIHKISQSSNYLLSLLNDVLDMSRIESGRMTLDYESFQMKTLLESVTDIILPQAEDKGQSLETEWILMHDSVNGDSVRIKQVLINLLSNAVKYTPRGGKLLFQVLETADKNDQDSLYANYRMKIYDNGYGMSEDFLKVIFEPFEKERSGAYTGVEGTGLGMAITKNIVDLMEGEISVESKLGEGTVFTVNLPLQLQLQETAGSGRANLTADGTFDCSGLRILLVEDNEITADVLKDILELLGSEVKWAADGKQAVSIFQKEGERYDVVLMDVQMPVIDGHEATKRIRKLSEAGANVPIIALTGNAFIEDVKASREAGMNHHISKPVQRRELLRVLKEVLSADQDHKK